MRDRKSVSAPADCPHVVLVGAGTAHLELLSGRAMGRWLADAEVTLVTPTATVLYSGMVPACVGGECDRTDATLDLVSLCARANARLVLGTAAPPDFAANTVHVSGRRAPLRYDYLAIAMGAPPKSEPDDAVPVRPLEGLLDAAEEWQNKNWQHIAIVGGGASGAELAAVLSARGFSVVLFERGPRILPDFPESVARRFRRRLAALKTTVRYETCVQTFRKGELFLESGERLPFDACVWATGPGEPAWSVSDQLCVDGQTNVFATGDGARVRGRRYRRNGVVAVLEGRRLAENLDRAIGGLPLRPFRLRRPTLWILNGGAGIAVAGFGRWSVTARWARRWKERIDRRWMARFAVPNPRASEMLCEGCGGKAPGRVLDLGLETADREDVGFWTSSTGQVFAGSVDALTSWTDDGERFAEIAVRHALSDVYAKGLVPSSALVAVTLPRRTPRDLARALEAVDRGLRQALHEEGVTLAGGHTSQGEKLAVAMSVVADRTEAPWPKGGARPGDLLVLTKPLGTGIVLAAMAQGACPAATWEACEASMRRSNREAAETARPFGPHAGTDVTGFGLAAAVREMAGLSGTKARFEKELPCFPGVPALYQSPLRPSLWEENRKRAGEGDGPPWAYDPQTSGGLLLAFSEDAARAFARKLQGFVVARLEK